MVGPATTADVIEAIRYARANGMPISIQAGGHGLGPVTGGMLLTMRRFDRVEVDPVTRVATIGGGARWKPVFDVAAPHGLMPVAGSTSHVGAVGYLLGGGLGAIIRSHGFSSDYVESFTVVTAAGEVAEASATKNPDLFWALCGGKAGFGVVIEARVRLVELSTLYGGLLVFAEPHIEAAFRGWLDWTRTAHPLVTTSTAIIAFPDREDVPERFRGRRVLMLRFAWPGDEIAGAAIAAPLRALAPAMVDTIGVLPAQRYDEIHSDPTTPTTAWINGTHHGPLDQEFATIWLDRFGAGTSSPFSLAELRHIGSAATVAGPRDDAVGGRDGQYMALLESTDPPLFAEIAPEAASEAMDAFAPWTLPVSNVNNICDNTRHQPWDDPATGASKPSAPVGPGRRVFPALVSRLPFRNRPKTRCPNPGTFSRGRRFLFCGRRGYARQPENGTQIVQSNHGTCWSPEGHQTGVRNTQAWLNAPCLRSAAPATTMSKEFHHGHHRVPGRPPSRMPGLPPRRHRLRSRSRRLPHQHRAHPGHRRWRPLHRRRCDGHRLCP